MGVSSQDEPQNSTTIPSSTHSSNLSQDTMAKDAQPTIADHVTQERTSLGSGTGAPEAKDGSKTTAEEPGKSGLINGRSKGKVTIIMLALCLAVFLAALDVTIITTALPTISDHFHSDSGYTWIGSAFLLANAASIPSWGKVSDIFGRKPMLLLANIIFMIGSLIAALSINIGMLIAARAIQGIGGGGLIILVNIIIGDLIPLRIRGAFYGVIGAVWSIASSIGPIIGGAFTEKVSWRWCFYINLPLDGVAFLILLFFLDVKTPRTPLLDGLKAIDWVGSLLVVGGTLMFLFGMQYGGVTDPWDSATVICLIVFGVITWGLFAFWEVKYAKYPVMPMGLFSTVTNFATLLCVFLHGMVFISDSYYLPLYFQTVRGASPILSGVLVLPTAVTLAISSIGTGAWIAKTGNFLPPIYMGFFFLTVGMGLFINFGAHSSLAKVILYQGVAGLGIGPLFQSPIIALQAHINPRDIGTATATLGFVRQIATTTSVVIGAVIFTNQMNKKTGTLVAALGPQVAPEFEGGRIEANVQLVGKLPPNEREVVRVAFADSLQPMWIFYTCLAGCGLIAALFIKRRVLNSQHTETKTGLEAEKENAAARLAERDAARASKRASRVGPSETPKTSSPTLALHDDDMREKDEEMGLDPVKA